MSKPRVLVVDDVRDMAETVARYLASHGFEVEAVTGGAEALARFAAEPADVS